MTLFWRDLTKVISIPVSVGNLNRAACVTVKSYSNSLLNCYSGTSTLFCFCSCVCLHADRRPEERSANLAKFKAKQVTIIT